MSYYREGLDFATSCKSNLLFSADFPVKFDFTTPLEDILKDVVQVKLDEKGFVQIANSDPSFVMNSSMNLVVDGARMKADNITQSCDSLLGVSDQIYGLNMNAAMVDERSYDLFVQRVLQSGKLRYLVALDLSYIKISNVSMVELCKFVNPVISGYNPMKRLAMCKCELKATGTALIIDALVGNSFVEELYLTGNLATDYAITSLVKLLQYSDSRLKCLGFGENSISSEGISKLVSAIARHPLLSQVQIHDNPYGDEGVNLIFREIRDTHVTQSLNLRNVGIVECAWAPRLSLLSGLNTLNISFNGIGDEGFVLICEGLQLAFSLKHLNLAHNKFGGKTCKCIGKMLVENRSLFTLDLSGNYFHHEVLSAVATGLYENSTLIEMNLLRCNIPLTSAQVIREALSINTACDVLLDFNPLPDGFRWNSRGDAVDEGDSVTSTHRSVHSRKDKETNVRIEKRAELIQKVKDAVLDDEDDVSIFSDNMSASQNISEKENEQEMNADKDDADGSMSLADTSVDYSAFSGDLNIYSRTDKEREQALPLVKPVRSSIISRRLARRAIKKTKQPELEAAEEKPDLTLDETIEVRWNYPENKFKNLETAGILPTEGKEVKKSGEDEEKEVRNSDAGTDVGVVGGLNGGNDIDDDDDMGRSVADSVGGESFQSTPSGFIVTTRELSSSSSSVADDQGTTYDYTGRAMDEQFPSNRNKSANYNLGDRFKNTGTIRPSKLPSDYQLSALHSSFDWCAMKVENMQKARVALKILQDQDLDDISEASATMDGAASVRGDASVRSGSSSVGSSFRRAEKEENASLTSQHLQPRIRYTREEREEEERVMKIDESKGQFRELIVTYGNRLEVLGLLLVEEATTFSKAHIMVRHMVRKFFQPTIDAIEMQLAILKKEEALAQGTLSSHDEQKKRELQTQLKEMMNLANNYYLADAKGKRVLDIESNKQRIVWSECGVRNDYYLQILPANGLYLEDEVGGVTSGLEVDDLDYGLGIDDGYYDDDDMNNGGADDDHHSEKGSGFGLLPLPSVMSDDMVPSISSTNYR